MNMNPPTSTAASSAEQSPQSNTTRRVHFGAVDEVHLIPADEFDPNSWYGAAEMKSAFRADVIEFLKEFQRSQLGEGSDEDCDDDSEREPVCGRGLEMYLPCESGARTKISKLYVSNVLRSHRILRVTYDDPDKAGKSLQELASLLGNTALKRAQAVGMQDALEARMIHAERCEESVTKDPDASEFLPSLILYASNSDLTTRKLSGCKARAA